MRIKDMKRAVILLKQEWDLGSRESGTSKELCAQIYLMSVLEQTHRFVYYKENGNMLGFAGYSKNNSKRYIVRNKIYTFIKTILYRSKKIKNLQALIEYENNYSYQPEYLNDYFDGEVTMLLLDSKCRGNKIGAKLLQQVFDLAKKDHIHNLAILTDESCSYEIYEKLGCQKVYETTVLNKEIDKLGNVEKAKVFIYEKKL